jgi:hypothetical protein
MFDADLDALAEALDVSAPGRMRDESHMPEARLHAI